ncbi:MAG TPA: methyltransferase domain-containing protein [bacterium]|nr:methyltransferase domain-containing protein [bacterium]
MEQNQRWDEIWSTKHRMTSGRLTSGLARDVIYRTVLSILTREVPDPKGKRILEVGSGTGLVSLALAKRGAAVTLCDISPEAVRFSKAVFARAGVSETTIQGSMLDLPLENDSFDVTWNAGVVEHFEEADQIKGVTEMLRVTRPEGRVVIAVPSARARIYLRAKTYADRHGAWQPGYEVPMESLAGIARQVPAEVVAEYRTGALAELHFLKYYFGKSRALRLAWAGLVEAVSLALFPLNRLPGYMLVCVLRKR